MGGGDGPAASGNALGEFLRARRAQLRPSDVDLPEGDRRRVPGLRREELAALAGISPDYYLRLEQGRAEHPSSQVLEALARALRLDDAAVEHLLRLGADTPPADPADAEHLAPGLARLLDELTLPAFIADRYLDCLASNALARALSPNFAPGRNLLRALFLDPSERALHLDWAEAAAGVVGGLRQVAGAAPDDPRFRALVYELCETSEDFLRLWSRADVGYRPSGGGRMRHPVVGDLNLLRYRFDIPDSAGQHLHVYQAEPGTDAATKLDRLERLTRSPRPRV